MPADSRWDLIRRLKSYICPPEDKHRVARKR